MGDDYVHPFRLLTSAAETKLLTSLAQSAGTPFADRVLPLQVCSLPQDTAIVHLARTWADADLSDRKAVNLLFNGWRDDQLKGVCAWLDIQIVKGQGASDTMRAAIYNKARQYLHDHSDVVNKECDFERLSAEHLAREGLAQAAAPPAMPEPEAKSDDDVAVSSQAPARGRGRPKSASLAESLFAGVPTGAATSASSGHRALPPFPHPKENDRVRFPPPRALSLFEEAPEPSDVDSDEDAEPDDLFEGVALPRSAQRSGDLSESALRRQSAASGVEETFSAGFMVRARGAAMGGSLENMYQYIITPRFPEKNESAKKECLAWARLLDRLDQGDTLGAMEVACRRLAGVQTAAETGNWKVCEHLEKGSQRRSFVPPAFMSDALKSVTREAAVRKAARDERRTTESGERKSSSNNKGGKRIGPGGAARRDEDSSRAGARQ